MRLPKYHIAWFRRDLRTVDHEPLARAMTSGDCLPLYIADTSIWTADDASPNQWDFVRECLHELRQQLAALGLPLIVRQGLSLGVFEQLRRDIEIEAIYSYRETSNCVTRQRDKSIDAWLVSKGIPWHRFQVGGVIPHLQSRDGWSRRWETEMQHRVINPHVAEGYDTPPISTGSIPTSRQLMKAASGMKARQEGGRIAGINLLESFLGKRGGRYHKEISSPLSAEKSCSRLSAHLTHGSLSMREVVQSLRHRQAQMRSMPKSYRGTWLSALRAFDARLHWHCHFIQKLEDEPNFEFENVHSSSSNLGRNRNKNSLDHWANGETGFPFIDACMRFLKTNGWINFRMRAMLTSFASYHLWLDWRASGLVLAKLFTDYEPGIHWNQMQMQSGTTGINVPRIYNPVKQSHDQDPNGVFIRYWVPELANLPTIYIHEPWLMSEQTQHSFNCLLDEHYPLRIVDHIDAAKRARTAIQKIRRKDGFKQVANEIVKKHGSRKKVRHQEQTEKKFKNEGDNQLTFNF